MSYYDINNLLTAHLKTLPEIQSFEVIGENHPPKQTGDFFITVKNLPSNVDEITFDRLETLQGLFSVGIFAKANTGRAKAETVAQLIRHHFKRVVLGDFVAVGKVEQSQGYVTDTHFYINVSVYYRTFWRI